MERFAVLLISLCLTMESPGQIQELTIEKDSVLTERVFLLKAIWNPGIVYEQPIASLSTVRVDAGVYWGYNTNQPWRTAPVLYGGIDMDVQIRHYFNLLRRTHNQRRADFNSAEFLFAGAHNFFAPAFSENANLTNTFSNRLYLGIGIGHQRVFKWLFYEVNLGFYGVTAYDRWAFAGPGLNIAAGINLTRKNKQKH
mgnify:CR=1 FL=1